MHDHDLGLSHDLHIAALRRRRALQWLAALGGSALAGCGDGVSLQTATVTGSVAAGYVAELQVGMAG